MKYFYITVLVAVFILSTLSFLLKKVWPAKTRGEYLVEIMKEKDNELYEVLESISKDTENTLEAVVFTHYSLVKDTDTVNDQETACDNFVTLVNDLYSNAKKGLLAMEVSSSQQLDRIATSLNDKKVVKLPGGFSFKELDEVFEVKG